jgi:nucleoside-diphosphate-sugar epimerase
MKTIDRSKPVVVTGATGYVGAWVVKRLLDDGITVHAAVRDPGAAEKTKWLDALADGGPGTIVYFESDLLEEGSYAEAMRGCELVFHTASPFTLSVADPQKELVEPALLGTRNVLAEADRTASVRRVVVTSSCAAIYGDTADLSDRDAERFTEEQWNTSSSLDHQPYSFSKTLAEREAWSIAGAQERWDLVAINPSFVMGPGINPFATSESFKLMTHFGDGTMRPGAPDFRMGVVDVREVAEAHVKAGLTPSASGRYIVSGHDTGIPQIAAILRRRFGRTFPFPRWTLPKPIVWLFGPLFDETLTRKMVARNVGHPFYADNRKSIRELGMSYRPLETSVVEMFQQLVDNGLVKGR